MKVHFLIASTRFTGGRQETLRHAAALGQRGHEVAVWVQQGSPRIDWFALEVPVRSLPGELSALPEGDVCLFDRVRLAAPVLHAGKGVATHLCQGFEGTDLDCKLAQQRERCGRWPGLVAGLRVWRRRREIDRAYRLPTAKVVTHRHLATLIAHRYRQRAWVVPYGLPAGRFAPPQCRSFTGQTVLVVGPTDTAWKRVVDALQAVRAIKQVRPGVRLIRVAQHPMRPIEHELGVTDEYHTMLPPAGMAELYRRADVLLLTSNATEGFGLPALEAMASGLPCVLTDIPAFRTFAAVADYAHFVPVSAVEAMAAAVIRLLDDPAERGRLSRRGLEVAGEYPEAGSRQALEEVLGRIAAGQMAPRAA